MPACLELEHKRGKTYCKARYEISEINRFFRRRTDEKGEREMEHLYEKALESAECPRAGNRQSGGRYHVPLAGRGDSENGVKKIDQNFRASLRTAGERPMFPKSWYRQSRKNAVRPSAKT